MTGIIKFGRTALACRTNGKGGGKTEEEVKMVLKGVRGGREAGPKLKKEGRGETVEKNNHKMRRADEM